MNEFVFLVEPSQGGGYIATSLGEIIRAEADNLPELRQRVKHAVLRHFGAGQAPPTIRLQFV